MKTRFPGMLGVFAAILMVASFVVPINIAAPAAVIADPGIMKWDIVSTPGSVLRKNDILNDHRDIAGAFADIPRGSEIISMADSKNGTTINAVVRTWDTLVQTDYNSYLYHSTNNGISWDRDFTSSGVINGPPIERVFQVVSAEDDAQTVVISVGTTAINGPRRILITTDGGVEWYQVFDGTGLVGTETIRCIAVSNDCGGKRDIAFGTVDGGNGGRWVVRSSSGFSNAIVQLNANGRPGDPLTAATTSGVDYLAIKFSPNYGADASVALVYANGLVVGDEPFPNATYFNVALRDLQQNTTPGYAYGTQGIEVKNPTSANGASPSWAELNNVDMELPSDFSGQSSSLRRAYISLDAYTFKAATTCEDGIYRIDDSTTYVLMDTTNTVDKAIYSIAYYGTYASGKLLVGERMGSPCGATVATWFTDSPTTCPIPCWYPALKPTTGAANQGNCLLSSKNGNGAAIVDWNADGSLGLVATGSLPYTVFGPGTIANGGVGYRTNPPAGAQVSALGKGNWWQMQTWDAVPNDESAFALSRNNGETWNQLGLIDTTIDWFNDVAVAPDCTTIYLASVNRNVGGGIFTLIPPVWFPFCNEFDSVWRASVNPNVTSPLPAIPPLGTYWERVYTRTTSANCASAQMDRPILRIVPSCTDKPDGEIVGWASQLSGTTAPAGTNGSGVMAWSPDYGDFWANISPRNVVQDFAFESSTTMYVLNPLGMVQRLPYSGTSWSTNLASSFSLMDLAHTIAAIPDGKVLVGAANGAQFPSSYSPDKGLNWAQSPALAGHGNEHVIFDVDFSKKDTTGPFMYMGDDTPGTITGSVYRNRPTSYTTWADNDMMKAINGATGIPWPAPNARPPHMRGQFGIVQAWTGAPQPTLYSAHFPINTSVNTAAGIAAGIIMNNSAVCRALKPRDGMPKPGIGWDCLDIFSPLNTSGVRFTLEPSSLKACGCCTLDTNTTLYAIDNESGGAALSGRWWPANVTPVGAWVYAIGYAPFMAPTAVTNPWGNGPQGMLWAYTDCLAKKGPVKRGPADQALIGADPVTGRNQQVDLSWEQLCLATVYELQITDKDPKDPSLVPFAQRINPGQGGAGMGNSAGNIVAIIGSILLTMDATNMTSPAAWIAPGALPEAGKFYWWRIRAFQSATGQLARSPWSAARSFRVKAGFIVNTPYYGVQLLAPNNACTGCKIKPSSFSWSPWKEATKYQFDLATDPEFKSLVQTATTTTTGYEYSGTLKYSTNYFWRVKAIEVNGQDIPSDWSATFSMETEPAPAPATTPPAEQPFVPLWAWIAIAIGAVLVIVTIVMVLKARRRY